MSSSSNTIPILNNSYSIGNVGTLTNGSSGSITFAPTTSSGAYILNSGVNIYNQSVHDLKYKVCNLPRNEMPEAVYVSGRMVTIGLLGSDVEAAYIGENKLLFAPGSLSAIRLNDKITLILQYNDAMYHYNVNHIFGVVATEADSNIVKLTQLSEIKRTKL